MLKKCVPPSSPLLHVDAPKKGGKRIPACAFTPARPPPACADDDDDDDDDNDGADVDSGDALKP